MSITMFSAVLRACRSMSLCGFVLLTAIAGPATADEAVTTQIGARTSLYVFGTALPFLFEVDGEKLNFVWQDVRSYGGTGIGTLTERAGEVIGVNGAYWMADITDPVPRAVTDEVTPNALVASFFPSDRFEIENLVDLGAFQTVLDDVFADTDTFLYLFRATGTLNFVEYQLAGAPPSSRLAAGIESGDSQRAVTVGTTRFEATDVPMTLVGIRAPAYLDGVMETPYHIHFLADDRSMMGHITALETDALTVEWTKVNAVNLHYWDVR